MIGARRPTSGTLNQVSKLNPSLVPRFSSGVTGTRIPSSPPSKNNAGPTSPLVKTGLTKIVPVFAPAASNVLPSKGHQPTNPMGGEQLVPPVSKSRVLHFPTAPATKMDWISAGDTSRL